MLFQNLNESICCSLSQRYGRFDSVAIDNRPSHRTTACEYRKTKYLTNTVSLRQILWAYIWHAYVCLCMCNRGLFSALLTTITYLSDSGWQDTIDGRSRIRAHTVSVSQASNDEHTTHSDDDITLRIYYSPHVWSRHYVGIFICFGTHVIGLYHCLDLSS